MYLIDVYYVEFLLWYRMTHNVERSRSIYGSILLLVVAIVVSLIGQASAAQASPTLDFGYHNYAVSMRTISRNTYLYTHFIFNVLSFILVCRT